MARTVEATVTCQVEYSYSSVDLFGTTKEPAIFLQRSSYAETGETDRLYRERYTVTSAAPNRDLDLDGALSDNFGLAADFQNVRAVAVKNLSTTAGDILWAGPLGLAHGMIEPFGGDTSGRVAIYPGGFAVFDAPKVAFGLDLTHHAIRVQYQGISGSIAFEVLFMGRGGSLDESSSSSLSTYSSWASLSRSSSSSSASSITASSGSSSSSSSTSSWSSAAGPESESSISSHEASSSSGGSSVSKSSSSSLSTEYAAYSTSSSPSSVIPLSSSSSSSVSGVSSSSSTSSASSWSSGPWQFSSSSSSTEANPHVSSSSSSLSTQ